MKAKKKLSRRNQAKRAGAHLALVADNTIDVAATTAAIEAANDPAALADLQAMASTMADLARRQGAEITAAIDAVEVARKAQRRCGQLIAEHVPHEGGRPKTVTSGNRLRLADINVTKKQSSAWQKLAALPEEVFIAELGAARKRGEPAALSRLLAAAQVESKQALAAELNAKPLPTPEGTFDVQVLDPPWRYSARADDPSHRARNPYPEMDLDTIKALPVGDRAEPNCVLWLWCTNAHMAEAYACLGAWGFTAKTILTWDKGRIGCGSWLRGRTEHCIVATRGTPTVTLAGQSTLLQASTREHSRKPDEFYDLVESLCPGTRLEWFARERRPGWQCWGAEVDRFVAEDDDVEPGTIVVGTVDTSAFDAFAEGTRFGEVIQKEIDRWPPEHLKRLARTMRYWLQVLNKEIERRAGVEAQ